MANRDQPLTPSEVLTIIFDWLKNYWEKPREKAKWTEVATVILTVLTAIAALWSVWIFRGQFREMSTQTINNHTDSVAAVETSRQTMQVDERAWIAVSGRSIRLIPKQPLSIELRIQNLGKTPANDVDFIAAIDVTTDESKLRLLKKGSGIVVNHVVMGSILPTADVHARVNHTEGKTVPELNTTEINAILRGQPRPYVHGRLEYADAFRCHHWVKFCFVFDPSMYNPSDPNSVPLANCEDKDRNGIDNEPTKECP